MQNQNETPELPLADLFGKALALAWDPTLPYTGIPESARICNIKFRRARRKGETQANNTGRRGQAQAQWGYYQGSGELQIIPGLGSREPPAGREVVADP